jgi:hypothetical protein
VTRPLHQLYPRRRIRDLLIPVFAAACVAAMLVMAGCRGSVDESKLEIENLHLSLLPSGAKIISGSVHNGSKDDVSGVLVQISLFDKGNNLLSTVTVGVDAIAAGKDQRFREPIDATLDVERARVKKIVVL